MMDKNSVLQIGNLVANPELRRTHSGNSVTNLLIANARKYTDREGNEVKMTTKHNIAVYGQLAEHCVRSLRAGSLVVIEGRLETREKEKDGVKYLTSEIVAESVGFGPNPRDTEWVEEEE